MKNISVLSGIPRRPSVVLGHFYGRGTHRLKTRLQRFVPQLVASPELWEQAAAVGHIFRYSTMLKSDPAVARRASVWIRDLPPYWKVQLLHQVTYEIDNLALGFEYIEKKLDTPQYRRTTENQLGLLLVRDNLEGVRVLIEEIPEFAVRLDLYERDHKMHTVYRRSSAIRSKDMPSQLRLARQMFDRHAWWAQPAS